MALDENNLPEGNGLKSSAISTVDTQGSGLSVSNTLQTLTAPRQGSRINQAAAGASFANDLATDPSIFSDGLRSEGFIDPNTNPEMYKTIYQSDATNAWNTLFNEMRTMRKSEVEDDLREVRIKLAEYENAKDRIDAFYGEGLISNVEHSNILKQIEEGHLRGGKDKVDLVDQLIDGVMGGLSKNLTAEDYANAVDRATKSGLLKRTEGLDRSYSKNTDTYQGLLEEKEQLKKDLEERQEEIRTGGFGSMFSGVTGRGDTWGSTGIPLPFYGGGAVEEDYHIRSKIEKAGGATAMSSLPIFSKVFGLSDSWTGDEYFQYKAAEDAAGSISTFEGQIASIIGPAVIQTLETQATNKYLKGVKNPYVRTASALTQFATIVAGNFWSRNLETKMEAGDAYWQKVDKLENALREDLKAKGINRELTKSEKNNIAIMANDGIGDLKRKNIWLGGSDVMQFALTFMKLPGLSKAFTGTTFRNIAAKELSSRMTGRLGINALKFGAAVGVSRELEGMEEGLQHMWVQDYLGTYGGETSGSFLNNQWNSMKRAGGDAIDYGLNMSGLRNSDPDMYESLAFRTAVQSGRDMATMMTGGGRTVSNWGGAKSLVELKQAMALLGEGGDNVNRKRLFEDKKNLMYKFFSQGNTANLYDAIYRMSRKVGSSKTALMTRQEAIEAIHEVQQAEKIYNDVFDNKSPLGISGFGISYDIGRLGGREAYTKADKKKVFLNALDVIENGKRNKELLEKQQSYREGKDESLDLYTTALTKEERAEYENKNTTKRRKKELEDKLTAEGVSLEQKERIKATMETRGFSSTPYDQELLENSEATEKRKKENEEIASEKKTWIGDPDSNEGALWDISEVEKVKALIEKRQSLMKKKDLNAADLMAIEDLERQENQIWYEQEFEYKALERGRLLNATKKAALIHGIGSVIQHIEKYGAEGLNKILPSILENNTKLDATTIKELQVLANQVVTNRQKVADSIKDLKKKREELLFDTDTLTPHNSLTQQEKEELLELRELEAAGTLDEAQVKRLANLVARSMTDKAVEGLTEEITALEAEEASLSETADMAEQYISRIESDPSDFLVNDSDFEAKSDDTILEEAALEAAEGMDYIKDQLKNIPDFADVENGQRIYKQIKEREDIFRRRAVEAEDSRKDYFENIANVLKLALKDMNSMLEVIKANAADRMAEQHISQERMFQDALSSLGLNLEFEVDEGAVFENVGKVVLETVGQPALNILKNSLKLNTDKVGVTLVLQGLLKAALADQSKVKTKLKSKLKKISASQTKAFTDIIEENFKDKVKTDFYLENPKIGLKNVLHQISTLNEDKDLNNRDSALWKYVDHLSPHKLLEDILKEDRRGLEASSKVLTELLMHHIFHLQAEKQLDLLNSDINVTDQLENEKFVLQNKTIEFIPTKQQLQSIRELSIFLKSEIANKDTLTLGGVSAFLQGAAGTGKSKIVLPWAIQTAGIPNRSIFAFGHNDNSSKTINEALSLTKKGSANTLDMFLKLDDTVAEDLEVIVIDEAPALNDIQYEALVKQIAHINALKHASKKPAIKVVMLGDQAQLTNEVVSPLDAFAAFKTMRTIITPVTSIYRSDNPAIANFQDTFRRRKEDLSKTPLTVKLNSSHPWRPGASGVYGVAGDFKERLILKLQNPAPNGESRVIITNPSKKEEYQSLIKANSLKDVKVMSFIEAQGETIDEVYMDIVREDMDLENFNKALYTATSRAQNLIVATNLNLKNTIDPQLDAVQQGLGLEIMQRREEFKTEVLENSKLLREFDELSDRDSVLKRAEEEIEEEKSVVDEFIDEAISEEDEARNEEQAEEQDKVHPETTRGEELNQEQMPEEGYDNKEDLAGYTENNSEEFDNNIDISDKHVLFYPEYDALSSTTIRKSTVLPVMSDRPVSFVKGRAVGRDGKIISGIVVLQEAREKLESGTRFFEYENKKVYRRIAVIGDNAEIDKMNFLTKAQKTSLKEALKTGVSIPLGELGIPGDKSLVSDTNNAVVRNNVITGVAIPKGGARRLTYKYGSRREAHFTSKQPSASNFLKQNKKLIDNILQKFIDSFYTESQPITDEQLKNIKQSRVKIFKKKDLKDLNVPEGFNVKSGRPYLVIKGVGNENKTQYIALTPRRISRDIKDDVKNYYQHIDAFGQAAAKIEALSQGTLKLGTKGFVDFIRGGDKMAQDIAVTIGNVAAMEELIELRDVIRDLRWSEVDTNSNGSISKQTQGVGPAQAAMNKLAQSNSIFRVERRIKRSGRKVRIVTSKSLLSFPVKGQSKGPITTQILETVFNSQDDKGYNHLLHLPLDIDMFNDLDSSGTSTTVRTAKQNQNAASKVLSSQLESIEGTKIILGKSDAVDEKRSKPKVTTTKKKKKKIRGNIGDINNLEGKEYREKSEDLKGSLISKDDANNLIKRLLPDLIATDSRGNEYLKPGNIVYLDALRMLELTENKNVLGKFIDQRIYLLEQKGGIYDNVIRHEVFHKITSYYLTDAERKTLFQTARVQYNIPKSHTNAQVEERLAREFMKFRADEKSVVARIRKIFKKILKFLGFIDKNADNIQKLFTNIDNGYFAGSNMVGDPVSTSMNFESLTEQWETVEIYREARSRFITGMDSLMSEYDDGQQDIVSEVDYENSEVSGVPMGRDEALNYLVENNFPDFVQQLESKGLGNLNEVQSRIYKASKLLSDPRKARSMFKDVYQRDTLDEGYELEEDLHLDNVNLSDVINDANLKDHSKNLSQSVIEVLTGISYTASNGKTKRLNIKHAYFQALQLLTNTYDPSITKMRANIKKKSKNLGNKLGTAGKAVEDAIIKLIDESFNTLNENNLHQIEVGKDRIKREILNEQLKNITGRTKSDTAKRDKIREKINNLDISDFQIPGNYHFVNQNKFIFSTDSNVIAADLLHDLSGQEQFSTVARKKNESSEQFYFRIYNTLDEAGMAIPTEALITLYAKGKATRDLKNLIVNTASLREETFMLGDYTYEWDDTTKSSVKKIRYYKHKEFGTRATSSSDISNFIESNLKSLKAAAPGLLKSIKKAATSKEKMSILNKFMSIIEYPEDRVLIHPRYAEQGIVKLEGFLQRLPDVGKMNKTAPKVESEKTGKMVYDTFTINDLVNDEGSLLEALGNMLKVENEATKAQSIKNVEGKTIYAFHNSSYGVDIITNVANNKKPEHLQGEFYTNNIFVNGQSDIREMQDWDGIIDRKRKNIPTTYSSEGEKQWLDRNFNYYFLSGLKEAKQSLYYTQQLTTVSDKSSPKAAQVKVLNQQQIKEAVTTMVEQYHKKPLKKSLVFSKILESTSLTKGQKVSRIIQELETRTDAILGKIQAEDILKNMDYSKAADQLNLKTLPKEEQLRALVSIFVSNYAVNSFFLNQLVLGDTANFKDSYDVVKRMSIAFAPGYKGFVNPLLGMKKTFRVAVMEDPQATAFDFLSPKERIALVRDLKDLGLDSPIDLADGQGFVLPSRLKDLRRGFGGGFNPGTVMKPVYYGVDSTGKPTALKYSTTVLTESLVENHPGLRALKNQMELAEVDELVFKSGVKVGAPNTLSKHGYPKINLNTNFTTRPKIDANSILTLDNATLRLQLDPTADPNALVSNPTQLAYMINTNGLNREAAAEYYQSMAKLIDSGRKEFLMELGLMNATGAVKKFLNLNTSRRNAIEKKIRDKIINAADTTESAHKEAEVLSATDEKGKPSVTINFPAVVNKIYQHLSSSLSKATIRIKFPGSKLILQSAYGATIEDPVTGKQRPLKHITADRPYAEVLMPRIHSDKFKLGDSIYDNNMMGFRIPSTELHSSVSLKVVGFYDAHDTNVIIAPKELVSIHGSDFDVDSLFVIRKGHITDKSKNGVSLYTNDDKGLVTSNKGLWLEIEKNEVIPSSDGFIIGVEDEIKSYLNQIRDLNSEMKLAEDNTANNEIKKKLKNTLEVLKRVEKAAIKNKMLDTYLDVIEDPKNRETILSPITMTNLKGRVKDGKDLDNSVFGAISEDMGLPILDNHEQLYGKKDLTNPLDEMYMHQSNQQGSKLTGSGANAMKALAYMMEASEGGNPALLVDKKTEDGSILPFEFSIDGITYSRLNRYEKLRGDKKSKHVIWQTMDSVINAAIDNSKEQILNILNLNQATASMFYVMIGTGVPLKTAVRIMLQPVVREAARISPKQFSKGASIVRQQITEKIATYKITDEQVEKLYRKIKLNTKSLKKGVLATSPRSNKTFTKQLGSIEDSVFQLVVLDLLSPEGSRKGLNKYGNDLSKVASTLKVLQSLPSNHEELTTLVENMDDIFSQESSFGFDLSNMLESLPHLQSAKDTAQMLYEITSEVLHVNNSNLKEFATGINNMLGSTSSSEDRVKGNERNKKIREEFVRFIASIVADTKSIEPIDVKRGQITTTIAGTQALSHRLGEQVTAMKKRNTTNAFLGRVAVNKDKRGIQYLSSNAAGITQEELVEVYADFNRLDPQLQEDILQYSIAKEGMLFAASNITMMIEPKRFAGYDQRRAKLLSGLLENPERLEILRHRFAIQYALTNPNLLASTGNKKISETIVEENGSKYGTRKDRLSTGETVFYDLKINNDLGEGPLFLSNPNYNQVYIRVHQDILDQDTKGFSYYQVVAKGSASTSFYTVDESDLNTEYSLKTHFPKNALVRAVEDGSINELVLYKQIKGLEKGDKVVLRSHDDVLRSDGIEVIISSISEEKQKDKITDITTTVSKLTFEDMRTDMTPFIELPEIGLDDTKEEPAMQKVSDAQTISEEAAKIIVSRLERVFGFKAKVINRPDLEWAGKFVADVPIINTAYMRADTAFHEFAHPWVTAIFMRNKPLFNKLKLELQSSLEGQAILAKVKERYPNLKGDEFFKEAIVTAIGEYSAGMIDEQGKGLVTAIVELLKRIGNMIKKLWNSDAIITPEELTNMDLRGLALLLAETDARLETNITEFKNQPKVVTKQNFLKRLQGEGVISPGEVQGYYAIMDIVPGTTERRPDLFEKHAAMVEQYEKDYPGLIRRVGNDVVFDFDVPVEEFNANAEYQVIDNDPITDEKGFEKIVEEDTLKYLESARDIENVRLSEDESNYQGTSGVYERLTHFVKTGVLGQAKDTVNSEYAAKKVFERRRRNIETDTILIENKPFTYQELVDRFQKKSNNSAARGKAVHKLMEWLVTKDDRILKDLREIQREKPDQDAITDASLKWVEQVGEGVLRKIGYIDTDVMKAELMLHSPILSIATQIDGLIQHEDGTLTMVDWKSGGYFLNDRSTAQMMRYSNGTTNDVSDSKLNKAMLELTLRAIMVKEHQPNAKFRQIMVHHLEKYNPFKQPFEVHVKDYLKIISNYLQAEKPEQFKALQEKGLLDANNYISQDMRNNAALDKYSHQPLEAQVAGLEKDIEILRTKIATPGMSNDLQSDKDLLEALTTAYLELNKTSKETLNSEGKLGDFKTWASSIYNINSPRIQAFNKIFRRASQKSQNKIETEKQIAEKLFKDVRDEFMAKNPGVKITGLATLGVRSGFDYKGLYDFAYEEKLDGVQTPGVYMISLEDAKAKYEKGELTDAQYNLVKHLRETWNKNWSELMDKKMESGNPYSKIIGMHNIENSVIEGKLHPNFMPRLPMESSEAYERYRGEGFINRQVKGTGRVLTNFAANTFSLFIEQNYYGQTDSINAHIPVRFMGSTGIIADSVHSFNLENMHYEFTANLMRKQEMDFVVALGDGLKSFYNTMKNLKGADDKGWKNYEKFMENFVINAVMQERTSGRNNHWSSKQYNIVNPYYDATKPTSPYNKPSYQFSLFKLMMAVKHITTGKALWFKFIGGTFNGAIILMYTTMKAVQGSVAKRLGYDPGVIDVTTSQLLWAGKEVGKYFGDQILRSFTNKPSNNKLHNLLKRFKYLPDNYDYAVDKSDMISLKNPTLTYDKLFFFHAIHEEWGHAMLLAAQMKNIKMADGSSIWDSYNDDGTFMKVKNGKANVRGVITDPSGVKRVIGELTEDEINKMLKMSTDIHGAYRTHERTVMESTALGVWALQFKKYLPALLMQELESRKDDVYMGKYTELTDDKGNKIKQTVEMEIDGEMQMVEMDTMDWITWQHEGRAKLLLKFIASMKGGQYTNYKYSNLNERDKYDLLGILSKFAAFGLMGLAMSGMDDDDYPDALMMRVEYLQKDALQGLMPSELLRTLKNPFAVIAHANSIIETEFTLSAQRKNIPFLSIGAELERYGMVER